MVLIGNPFSGVGSAPELLPQPIGAIGQLMPPGAGGNLLRSTGFFDGAGAPAATSPSWWRGRCSGLVRAYGPKRPIWVRRSIGSASSAPGVGAGGGSTPRT